MKNILVLGGGGFIGGHLARRLKNEGNFVRVVDIKERHDFWNSDEICHEYVCGDLREQKIVSEVMNIEGGIDAWNEEKMNQN